MDFRTTRKTTPPPLHINREKEESVSESKSLGTHITKNLKWTINTSHLVKKSQQRLFFLRKLKKAKLTSQLLVNFFMSKPNSVDNEYKKP